MRISLPLVWREPMSSLKILPVFTRRRACSRVAERLLMQLRSCLFETTPRARLMFVSADFTSLSHASLAPLVFPLASLRTQGGGSSPRYSRRSSGSCLSSHGAGHCLPFFRNFSAAVCFAIEGDQLACRILSADGPMWPCSLFRRGVYRQRLRVGWWLQTYLPQRHLSPCKLPWRI